MRRLVIIFTTLSLVACGTVHDILVKEDKLTGKNICAVSTLKQTDYLTTGNPAAVRLITYHDNKIEIKIFHYYPLVIINKTKNLKNVQIRIDLNEVITLNDHNQDDELFIINNRKDVIDQMISGSEMILRVNYYSGHTKDFEFDLKNFRTTWKRMLSKCGFEKKSVGR